MYLLKWKKSESSLWANEMREIRLRRIVVWSPQLINSTSTRILNLRASHDSNFFRFLDAFNSPSSIFNAKWILLKWYIRNTHLEAQWSKHHQNQMNYEYTNGYFISSSTCVFVCSNSNFIEICVYNESFVYVIMYFESFHCARML